MKILFSPVGMTDPVSLDIPKDKGTYHEGALLQICRHYKPDLVYIYMSKESLELETEDHRYLHGLELLKNDTGLTFEPDSAKFKGIKTVKNHDDTAFYVCFGVIENFTHQVKLQAVIILPINNVISMQFSHFCQSNFADSGLK